MQGDVAIGRLYIGSGIVADSTPAEECKDAWQRPGSSARSQGAIIPTPNHSQDQELSRPITFDEAIATLVQETSPLPSERLPLRDCIDRYLAETLLASVNSPSRPLAAMDGYAVSADDLASMRSFSVVNEVSAGCAHPGRIERGQAARIYTGAPIPAGADLVVMQEYSTRQGSEVSFADGFGPANHVRMLGSDFHTGDVLVVKGTRLGPREIIAAAAADQSEVKVSSKPIVSIIATGDEIAEPGTCGGATGKIPESVSYGVAATCRRFSAEVLNWCRVEDDQPKIARIAKNFVASSDCVVVIGGASVGARDFSRDAFASIGNQHVFQGVAMKPGKPVWFGKAGSCLVLGLPGYPASATVLARLFLEPLLIALQGGDPYRSLEFESLPLAVSLPANGQRETFLRAFQTARGIQIPAKQESGAQAALVACDRLVRRMPNSSAAQIGDFVECLRF